jgi:hypothetical protein
VRRRDAYRRKTIVPRRIRPEKDESTERKISRVTKNNDMALRR